MSINKKYFYLKLKDNFFETDEMIILESMQDGYKYSNILLKLYLRSLKSEGRLMVNDRIPFNSTMLAQVTRHSVGDIEKAVVIFKDLGLIDVLDNGAIYLSDIHNFIGHSSSEAERKKEYRAKITTESGTLSQKCPDIRPPEIELELNIEKDIEIKDITCDALVTIQSDFDIFWKAYPRKVGKDKAKVAWNKKKDKPSIEEILKAVHFYKLSKPVAKGFVCLPATWINEGRWSDEAEVAPQNMMPAGMNIFDLIGRE